MRVHGFASSGPQWAIESEKICQEKASNLLVKSLIYYNEENKYIYKYAI